MTTLGMEALARKAPNVSFIHNFPGAVATNLIRGGEGWMFQVTKPVFKITMIFRFVPILEVGESHLFYCTSAKYPPGKDVGGDARLEKSAGIPLQACLDTARGIDGEVGSGMYSIDEKGESAGAKIEALLAEYRKDGVVDRLWTYTESRFRRVTGSQILSNKWERG